MLNVSRVEILFYGGIALVALALLGAVVLLIIYFIRGTELKGILMEEYGNPEKYSLHTERKQS